MPASDGKLRRSEQRYGDGEEALITATLTLTLTHRLRLRLGRRTANIATTTVVRYYCSFAVASNWTWSNNQQQHRLSPCGQLQPQAMLSSFALTRTPVCLLRPYRSCAIYTFPIGLTAVTANAGVIPRQFNYLSTMHDAHSSGHQSALHSLISDISDIHSTHDPSLALLIVVSTTFIPSR